MGAGILRRMLLTQEGIRALYGFSVHAAPLYDDDGNRVSGNDGVTLICTQAVDDAGFTSCAAGGRDWRKHWPGHVAAPRLRDLILVAQQHWNEAHRVDEPKTGEAAAPEDAVTQ